MKKSICLATVDFLGLILVGGIGTYYHELAQLLSQNGWEVVVLFHTASGNEFNRFAEKYYETYKIPIYNANDLCEELGESLLEIWRDTNFYQARSHIFDEAIHVLMKKYGYKFDFIEFPDWGGAGFIPVKMNNCFKHYKNLRTIVKLHGSSLWSLEGCGQESLTFEDLKNNYIEQYAFENADIQVSPTYHLLNWCKEHGWGVRSDASICKYSFNLNLEQNSSENTIKNNEIIFFGRFEERKGVFEFIEALKYVKSISPAFSQKYRITFLGKEARLSRSDIQNSLDSYEIKFLMIDRSNAIKYLQEQSRLVIIPSRLDNFPNTILECMYAKIPFITSRSGGIPEMLGVGTELYEAISFDIEMPKDLGKLILKYLDYNQDYAQKILNLAYERGREITDSRKILEWYNEALVHIKVKNDSKEGNPGVAIIIPTRNLTMAKYFECTLLSLLNQTYKNIKIIVKDSSTDQDAISMLSHLQKKYPNVTFIHKEDSGVSNALNQALPYVDTKYVMQVDGDNIAKQDMVEQFVKCIENRNDVIALASYFAAFTNERIDEILQIEERKGTEKFIPHKYYKPIGPIIPLLFFENVQGDANSIFVTEVVKSVGGWPEGMKGFSDWIMWIKLLANGYNIDVIPKVLYYYRDYQESDAKTKKLFNIDESNLHFIQKLIENNPKYFAKSYRNLHRVLRGNYNLHNTNSINQELQELQEVKKSASYILGSWSGKLAQKSVVLQRLLELSRKIIKKTMDMDTKKHI